MSSGLNNNNFFKESGEGVLFLTPDKQIIKIYSSEDEPYLRNKLKTITYLNEIKTEINIQGLIIPNPFYENNKFIGAQMPFINGTNTGIILNSSDVPFNVKINILKQIGILLKQIRKYYNKYNLAFADVHPDNFIFNGTNTYGIDADSMKVKDNISSPSPYLINNPNLDKLDKYPCNIYGLYVPNANTDLLSFIMMILNVISGKEIHTISIDLFMKYLDYLDKCGFDSNLLISFASIYENDKDNIDPTPYLDKAVKTTIKSFKH